MKVLQWRRKDEVWGLWKAAVMTMVLDDKLWLRRRRFLHSIIPSARNAHAYVDVGVARYSFLGSDTALVLGSVRFPAITDQDNACRLLDVLDTLVSILTRVNYSRKVQDT